MQNQEPINNTEQDLNQNQTENLSNEDSIEADELQQVHNKVQEYHDSWLRAKAELENARRRNLEDLEKMRKFCIENFAESLLSVMDSLQAAANDNSGSLETIKQGIDLTLKQLQSAFDKHKIISINPIDEILNPAYHQAVSMAPSEKPLNTVLEIVQKGYTISDRLMRPALVVVSSGSTA